MFNGTALSLFPFPVTIKKPFSRKSFEHFRLMSSETLNPHEYKVSKLFGNVHKGSVYSDNCRDCFVQTYNDKIVATIGLNNLVIVDTEDALLVSNKSNSQDIKKIVSQLEKDKKEQIFFHRKVYRPW